MSLRTGLLLGITAVLAACGSFSDRPADSAAQAPTPQARCEAWLARLASTDHARLVAVFESTALEVAAWHESGLMPGGARAGLGKSPFRKHPPEESVASCYYDGTFVFRGPIPEPLPGAGSAPPRIFERLLLIIDSVGNNIDEHGGSKERLPLVRPVAGPAVSAAPSGSPSQEVSSNCVTGRDPQGSGGVLTACPGRGPVGTLVSLEGQFCNNPQTTEQVVIVFGTVYGENTGRQGAVQLPSMPVDPQTRFVGRFTIPEALDTVQGYGGGSTAPGVYHFSSKPDYCAVEFVVTPR